MNTENAMYIITYHYIPIETVSLAKATNETRSEGEPSNSDVSPFWSLFLYMLIEKLP